MDIADLSARLAVALGVGLLVGLERGWERRGDARGSRTAGVRTFALSGGLGGVLGALSQAEGSGAGAGWLLGLGFAAFSVILALFVREENRAAGSFSATTAVAGMATFALGAYAVVGDIRIAAAGAVVAASLLALREGLHRLVAAITWDELRAGLMLLAMTFVALPLLPDGDIGPFGGINLREIWLIAIVLAAVSFCGYVAVKHVGESRGTLLAAAAGGLVSSTAIMISYARRAATGEPRLLAAGVSLATAVSLVRTMAIVAALDRAVAAVVAVPLLAAALAAAGFAFATRGIGSDEARRAEPLRNPFELRIVLGFALLLAALEMLARFLTGAFGAGGAISAAVIAGAGDVDAATVAVTHLAGTAVGVNEAALAVLAAVVSNNVAKLVFGVVVGGRRFARWTGAAVLAAALAGVGGWMVGGLGFEPR